MVGASPTNAAASSPMLGRARAHAPRSQGIVSAPGYNEVVVQLESRPRDRRAGLRGSSRGAPGRRLDGGAAFAGGPSGRGKPGPGRVALSQPDHASMRDG